MCDDTRDKLQVGGYAIYADETGDLISVLQQLLIGETPRERELQEEVKAAIRARDIALQARDQAVLERAPSPYGAQAVAESKAAIGARDRALARCDELNEEIISLQQQLRSRDTMKRLVKNLKTRKRGRK